jgi:hypothetical protein
MGDTVFFCGNLTSIGRGNGMKWAICADGKWAEMEDDVRPADHRSTDLRALTADEVASVADMRPVNHA